MFSVPGYWEYLKYWGFLRCWEFLLAYEKKKEEVLIYLIYKKKNYFCLRII